MNRILCYDVGNGVLAGKSSSIALEYVGTNAGAKITGEI